MSPERFASFEPSLVFKTLLKSYCLYSLTFVYEKGHLPLSCLNVLINIVLIVFQVARLGYKCQVKLVFRLNPFPTYINMSFTFSMT